MGDSCHTHKTHLSLAAAVVRERESSESGSEAFYDVRVLVCLPGYGSSLAAASCRIPIGPLQLMAQLLIWGGNHCQNTVIRS